MILTKNDHKMKMNISLCTKYILEECIDYKVSIATIYLDIDGK